MTLADIKARCTKAHVCRDELESTILALCSVIERQTYALKKVKSFGLHHYEDCANRAYDDEDCTCGMFLTDRELERGLEALDRIAKIGEV